MGKFYAEQYCRCPYFLSHICRSNLCTSFLNIEFWESLNLLFRIPILTQKSMSKNNFCLNSLWSYFYKPTRNRVFNIPLFSFKFFSWFKFFFRYIIFPLLVQLSFQQSLLIHQFFLALFYYFYNATLHLVVFYICQLPF